MEHLITLRRGEMVRDQPTSSIVALDEEILKIRGKENSSICLFFQANPAGCSIYERRPAECRALSCSDPAPLKAMYKQDRLTRSDLLPEGHPLLELVDEHDHRCDPAELGRLCQQVLESQDQDVINVIGGMLTYDRELRTMVMKKAKLPAETMNFLFGRPLNKVLEGFGLKSELTAQGIRLTKNPFTR